MFPTKQPNALKHFVFFRWRFCWVIVTFDHQNVNFNSSLICWWKKYILGEGRKCNWQVLNLMSQSMYSPIIELYRHFQKPFILNKSKKIGSYSTPVCNKKNMKKTDNPSWALTSLWVMSNLSSADWSVCPNSCEKSWRQNSIMTDLQHLLYWTLFVWSKGLCSANKSPLLPLSHGIMTTELRWQCGQRGEEWTSPHRPSFARVHSGSDLFKLPSGKLFSCYLATVRLTTFISRIPPEFCVPM